MLQYEKTDVSEGTGINKSNKSKECIICHYWYFKDIGYKFEPYVCNNCHDILAIVYEFKNIGIINVEGVVYRCILQNMTKKQCIKRLNNSKLDEKGTL